MIDTIGAPLYDAYSAITSNKEINKIFKNFIKNRSDELDKYVSKPIKNIYKKIGGTIIEQNYSEGGGGDDDEDDIDINNIKKKNTIAINVKKSY